MTFLVVQKTVVQFEISDIYTFGTVAGIYAACAVQLKCYTM